MNFFDIFPFILAVIFMFLLGWLLPKTGKTYDVLKMHLDLFPHWFKWIGIVWFAVAFTVFLFVFHLNKSGLNFLVLNTNFSLFLFLFSREKREDEFSEQIRLKAFVYAFISFIGVIIIYGALQESRWCVPVIFNEFTFVLVFLGIALISSLIYFYMSIFYSNK
ncbi:hypothetical protein GM418_20590 [Maribellus comscasis]|uniref:Uncharacterized protein n=1 Tax=Maribellus comscasis TaxID=2681766 RepID=A0A6I6JXA4_9BACT|nr:hypothetical protein [Maribellus comscasis]QGY45979.1 hypothetical protein GM418_20590 [Maribellus comscasis]